MLAWLKQYFYLEESIALKLIDPAVWRELWRPILSLTAFIST